jgi:hypothetical protein
MKYRSNFHIQGVYIDKLLNKEDYAKVIKYTNSDIEHS